jgi:hypothetical protein
MLYSADRALTDSEEAERRELLEHATRTGELEESERPVNFRGSRSERVSPLMISPLRFRNYT